MKKLILAKVIMMITISVGCSGATVKTGVNEIANTGEMSNNTNGAMADILINIEGIVAKVDGNKITLDTGQVILITDDTAFETQNIGEVVKVMGGIEVGNFIQGYTSVDSEADEVIADIINTNEKMN